ncbi:MAG: hypothetical protein A3K19_11980 [Lentisphaerae bacterium RIFOXYB12_FULL_65_16]|nr:MAG: hypothetical protein A3K18_17450 [Lentisphaerae bacterium RIFOXYA12_64_32]OGV95145.1 MAG: hypothetical protein A3K19_11980 [Lentisphaerae bacterium RIFOXYB12_FULL_65_16]
MWRFDAGRTANSPENLPAELHLQWMRQMPPPRPAWPASQAKLQFDAAYAPVVQGTAIFVPSMVNDSVTAYETQTGNEAWRFYSDGPVRFAPVAWKDHVFFVSDDGCLYCLDAASGALRWRFRGGPSDQRILGNDRLISMWPARGGPVLHDGVLYFAAGIWPFMGIFIHAVDAETGKPVWTNSGSGAIYILQQHDSPAFAGVAPQGYFAVCGDTLLVSGGRTVPAAYDLRTGEFRYFHAESHPFGKDTGGYDLIAKQNWFFNGQAMFDISDGVGLLQTAATVVTDDTIFAIEKETLKAHAIQPEQKKGSGKTAALPQALQGPTHALLQRWQLPLGPTWQRLMLKAGDRLYLAGDKAIGTVQLADGKPLGAIAETPVAGTPWTMLVADGRLFTVTTDGALHCYGATSIKPVEHPLSRTPAAPGPDTADRAKELLAASGVTDGYCVVVGVGDGELPAAIAQNSSLHVIGLEPDAQRLDAVRRRLDAQGLYGTRVVVHAGDLTSVLLPPYLASLIVVPTPAGIPADGKDWPAKLFRCLRPYGGTARLTLTDAQHKTLLDWTATLEPGQASVTRNGDSTLLRQPGGLPGAANWTHQYVDAANSIVSKDRLVKPPLGLLWFGGPPNDPILPRHGHGPTPQVVDGRLFIEGADLLRAVDVYTGRLLWERDLPGVGKFFNITSHQPGANEIGSNYASAPDGVYVMLPDSCTRLNPATGEVLSRFTLPDKETGKPAKWGSVRIWQDLLLATASPISIPPYEPGDVPPLGMVPIIPLNAEWRYLAGTPPPNDWAQPGFTADSWKTGRAGFGTDPKLAATVLADMPGKYASVCVRKEFELTDVANIQRLVLLANYDDAFCAYLNGEEVARAGLPVVKPGEKPKIPKHVDDRYDEFEIKAPRDRLRNGANVLAIEAYNCQQSDKTFLIDTYLAVLRQEAPPPANAPVPLAKVPRVVLDSDYAAASKTLAALDRQTGKVRWSRDAEQDFRHNGIAVGAGKVFCVDGYSKTKAAFLKRRGHDAQGKPRLLALDAPTGKVLWQADERVFGTWLGYSEEFDILLEAGSRAGDRARDEEGSSMTAYRGADGTVLWRRDVGYYGPPILYHNRIITQTGGANTSAPPALSYSLETGEPVLAVHPLTGENVPWSWVRFKGCNTAVASEHLLTFRSAAASYADIESGHGTVSLGGFKSGCTSNLLAADGILNAPDYTRTCTCAYQNQASVALVHVPPDDPASPAIESWSFDFLPAPDKPRPVRRVGLNFGAPGNRLADNATLWLECPSVGGPSPDLPVSVLPAAAHTYRQHESCLKPPVAGSAPRPLNWVAASGIEGVESVRVRLFLQPGAPEANIKIPAFERHAGTDQFPDRTAEPQGSYKEPRPYTVVLHFAELQALQPGNRVFDVLIQGEKVLDQFDIAREAGGTNTAVTREFRHIKVQDDLVIAFRQNAKNAAGAHPPTLSGIEILAEE